MNLPGVAFLSIVGTPGITSPTALEGMSRLMEAALSCGGGTGVVVVVEVMDVGGESVLGAE